MSENIGNYEFLIKKIWDAVYDLKKDFDETFENFFHQNYSQCINGVHMDRNQYREHVLAQRKNVTMKHIDYQHIVTKGNELFALYYPEGVNSDNETIRAEVIAYFRFEGSKIIRIHGQVQLIQGNLNDVDMQK